MTNYTFDDGHRVYSFSSWEEFEIYKAKSHNGKHPHSLSSAQAEAKRLTLLKGKKYRFYRCPCGFYHVGSNGKGSYKDVTNTNGEPFVRVEMRK